MKRHMTAIALVLVILLSLTACTKKTDDSVTPTPTETEKPLRTAKSNNASTEGKQTQTENSNESEETFSVESETSISSNVSANEKQIPLEDANGSEGELSEEESAFYPLGWWGNSPGGADRLSDTYVFREDGTFTFYYNEHFFSIREKAFSGTWEWREDTLFLTKLKKRIIVGGKLVSSSISSDNYEIEDGEVKIEDINPPEEITLMVGEYNDNADGFYNYPSVFLNDKQYWRIYDNTPIWMDEYWK